MGAIEPSGVHKDCVAEQHQEHNSNVPGTAHAIEGIYHVYSEGQRKHGCPKKGAYTSNVTLSKLKREGAKEKNKPPKVNGGIEGKGEARDTADEILHGG